MYATHIKDTNPDTENKAGYKFVESEKGKVDIPLIFKNLEKIGFNGWNIVELNAFPVKDPKALESGQISKKYLKKIKVKF